MYRKMNTDLAGDMHAAILYGIEEAGSVGNVLSGRRLTQALSLLPYLHGRLYEWQLSLFRQLCRSYYTRVYRMRRLLDYSY